MEMCISSSFLLSFSIPSLRSQKPNFVFPRKTHRSCSSCANFSLLSRRSFSLLFQACPVISLCSPKVSSASAVISDQFIELQGSGGVKYFDLRNGDGASPVNGDQVISGIEAAVKSMKVGGIRRVIVPPSQGYQNTSQEPIPPNFFDRQRLFTTIFNPTRLANGEGSTLGTLIFDIELLSIRHS
ncbi:peptidyl-prolyl cis-trans isomerase FKBP17-1, chloroplastic isoform X2 [Amborella trichopoda]|uniref:peptidyl-prolyl cis-trans isomerase FKBP17-1, chloroplastic isoform X2 n=1 Tax=Amborella trichopoda TaxID=13333 RepID=UPI0005D3125A|nr:peptidyl-prolyl cis-trans isomerase FKBP17-1, chloroplastic isoform X2 [Amborella trichopoda]|eukprot:XP_011626608.1 peptidyl-prolyl cis-trans isomerase FKBP17-1, chloroplastic isoform X2 [Amborella trichopoda]